MQWRKWLPRVYDVFFGAFSRLRPIQENAIPMVLEGHNLLLIAPTGSGKTEAAIAPLAEKAIDYLGQTYALYIAPTRALANDLEIRLSEKLEQCELRLAIRHGERNTIRGRRIPSFILTTPESLEVMLSTQPDYVKERLREVRAVIVDEVHQFFGTRRGLQLACLLERLKHYTGRPLQRIGLSATVANPDAVANFLQGSDAPLSIIAIPGQRPLRVYLKWLVPPGFRKLGEATINWIDNILLEHKKVLLFANTRASCDWLCWQLNGRLHIPAFVHYSSLHRDYRKSVEREFRQSPRAICVATSTMELGIDIGDVDAIAMWGSPHTVSSFLQRLGRGNRRAGTGVVYAACPGWFPAGSAADPDDDLLRFVALTWCATKNELEARSEPHFYSVLVQQILALCRQYGHVAPDLFFRNIAHHPPFTSEQVIKDILAYLTENKILDQDERHEIWLPMDKFYEWQRQGLFWSNLGGQESTVVVDEGNEQPIPLVEIPREYAYGLRPGRIILFAGKPCLVTRLEKSCVWVTNLQHENAELARYKAPPEPTPQTVAQAIREVLTVPENELQALPILYDDGTHSRLRWWRDFLGESLRKEMWTSGWYENRWVLYTFAGSTVNWLLGDIIRSFTGIGADADSWRVSCSKSISLRNALAGWDSHALENLVRNHWYAYLQWLALPPLFRVLPEKLQQAEVFSLLALTEAITTFQQFI